MSQSYACPFCDAAPAELISLFGSQLLTSQYRCVECGSYFEGVRDLDQPTGVGVSAGGDDEDGD